MWAVEMTATGSDGAAVRLLVRFDHEPTSDDISAVRAEASGLYRRFFREWCAGTPRQRVFQTGV